MAAPLDEVNGPEDLGVQSINAFGKKMFKGALHCKWTPNKGRVLHATRSWQPGEIILVESPTHIVQEMERSPAWKKLKKLCKEHEDDFDYEPLWYWCAVQSLTKEQLSGAKAEGCTGCPPETQGHLLLLHHEEVIEPSVAAQILARELVPSADPITIERLIQVWVLNCFEFSDNPQGYSTYFYSSFMSHSCFPNAVWHYTGSDHVLRSRREIHEGEEVCISYLPESGLLQSAPSRRMELNETKRFWCDCERCMSGKADGSRGMKCPKCGEGLVFAQTPVDGPAKDASLLAAHFVGSVCTTCQHVVSKAEATKLANLEKQLEDIVEKYTDLDTATIKQLQADEGFIDKHFGQHVQMDLAWEQMISHYASKRRGADQRRLLQRRCDFHKAGYPGLSGAHAWALEALGDCLHSASVKVPAEAVSKEAAEANRKVGKGSGSGSQSAAVPTEQGAAKECYVEALKVLMLMFGSDHEYVTDVEKKKAENHENVNDGGPAAWRLANAKLAQAEVDKAELA